MDRKVLLMILDGWGEGRHELIRSHINENPGNSFLSIRVKQN